MPLQDSFESTGKKSFDGVDTETADGTNVMPKPWRGVDSLEVLCVSMPPVELVKFLIVRAARRSAVGDVRKVSVDGHWRSQLARANDRVRLSIVQKNFVEMGTTIQIIIPGHVILFLLVLTKLHHSPFEAKRGSPLRLRIFRFHDGEVAAVPLDTPVALFW